MKMKTPITVKRLELLAAMGEDDCILVFQSSEPAWKRLIASLGGGFSVVCVSPLPKGRVSKFHEIPRDMYITRCIV